MAETGPKQQDSSAAMAAVNGGRQVARFNVTTPSGVTPSPAGDVDVAPAATPAVDDRDRRDVSPSRFRVEFVAEAAPADDRPMSIGSGSTTAAGHSTYDTQHQKTFGHNTLDALPHADHYRNLLSAVGHIRKRPTLLELHELSEESGDRHTVGESVKLNAATATIEETQSSATAAKFGWIQGVLVRCVLNIFGVMLFLRISWVVGQAGIGLASLVILLASVVTTLTALSMSAICTNGQVRGGGAYYLISRSLGPEFGGAIGIVFSFANAVAAAMYVVGFAETIRDVLKEYDCLMTDEINDVRIIGVITAVVMMAIALAGLSWESKAQLVLLVILLIAVVNFMIGTFIPASETKQQKGITGYSMNTFRTNFVPDFRDGHTFFSVFAIFFPAATGVLAGANISGDLRDAQRAIPKGTLVSILTTTITYLVVAWMAGWCVVRDAVGPIIAGNNTWLSENVTAINNSSARNGSSFSQPIPITANEAALCSTQKCRYGLLNDMQVMQLASAFGPIIIAGIVSATLSSALASLISAPKVFQAVCKDKIFPRIHVFATGYGTSDEPRRAYALTFFIAVACVCIGDLNLIAPLISNFFLMSYALVNYSCFDASLAKSPGWRPAFKFYSMWLSLVGAVLCICVMFIMSWVTALVTMGVIAVLFFYVHYRKPDINWGSSTQAHVYRSALQNTMKLVRVTEHVKNFRPQILVLTGFPEDRPSLVDFTSSITKNVSLMICGQVVLGNPLEQLSDVRKLSHDAHAWLARRKTKSFYTALTAETLRLGVQSMLQSAGLGKLRPNVLLMGFKSDWQTAPMQAVADYFAIIHDAFDQRCGVGILRIQEGFYHCPAKVTVVGETSQQESNGFISQAGMQTSPIEFTAGPAEEMPRDEESEDDENDDEDEDVVAEAGQGDDADVTEKPLRDVVKDELLRQSVSWFDGRQKRTGFIDVWWLFDDGGLTLLVPYILTTKKLWSGCKLRVFMAGTKKTALDHDQRQLATLLSKFRIEYSSMTVIPDMGTRPSADSKADFDKIIAKWMLKESDGEAKTASPWMVSDTDLWSQSDKTNRHIRLHELLMEHSHNASLIVMTLPMPRKGLCAAGLYMAWLDTLTRDMPPMLLLRGNQENVLTYYS